MAYFCVDRTFALIDELSEPLDEALCSQAVEAAIRTQRGKVANRFMETQCDVEPDRITYSTLIKGYCVAGRVPVLQAQLHLSSINFINPD
eukprot:Skav215867  [mRNA]  locus=scaffold3733:29451:34038:+ [translate_table: standard]